MARPYRKVGTLLTTPTEEESNYEQLTGMALDWLPGHEFPVILEHGKEYHLCQREGVWVIRGRIAPSEPNGD